MADYDDIEGRCPKCKTKVDDIPTWTWERQGEIVTCQNCGAQSTVDWDDPYNEESGEVETVLFLELVPAPTGIEDV